MNFFITLLFTLLLVALALWVFMRIGSPVYRVERENVVRLLELVVAGQATEQDWDVFVGVPIRHDPELDAVRERCKEVADRELLGGDGVHLFTRQGITELQEILDKLTKDNS